MKKTNLISSITVLLLATSISTIADDKLTDKTTSQAEKTQTQSLTHAQEIILHTCRPYPECEVDNNISFIEWLLLQSKKVPTSSESK